MRYAPQLQADGEDEEDQLEFFDELERLGSIVLPKPDDDAREEDARRTQSDTADAADRLSGRQRRCAIETASS
jgi:hypothetical protein